MKADKPNRFLKSYFGSIKKDIDLIETKGILRIIKVIRQAYKKDKKIFVFGNGGSASTASHFATDLAKNCSMGRKKRFKAISLNDNVSLMTAYSNDVSYEDIFSEQLKNFIGRDDVVIGISVSGNSKNIIKAIETAKRYKAKTMAFLGFNGSKVKNIVDEYIIIEDTDYGRVESLHLAMCHIISSYLLYFKT